MVPLPAHMLVALLLSELISRWLLAALPAAVLPAAVRVRPAAPLKLLVLLLSTWSQRGPMLPAKLPLPQQALLLLLLLLLLPTEPLLPHLLPLLLQEFVPTPAPAAASIGGACSCGGQQQLSQT